MIINRCIVKNDIFRSIILLIVEFTYCFDSFSPFLRIIIFKAFHLIQVELLLQTFSHSNVSVSKLL